MATSQRDGQGLRETTGVGMMDCKQALSKPRGHAGSDRLLAKRLSKAAKKAAALPRRADRRAHRRIKVSS